MRRTEFRALGGSRVYRDHPRQAKRKSRLWPPDVDFWPVLRIGGRAGSIVVGSLPKIFRIALANLQLPTSPEESRRPWSRAALVALVLAAPLLGDTPLDSSPRTPDPTPRRGAPGCARRRRGWHRSIPPTRTSATWRRAVFGVTHERYRARRCPVDGPDPPGRRPGGHRRAPGARCGRNRGVRRAVPPCCGSRSSGPPRTPPAQGWRHPERWRESCLCSRSRSTSAI